jgi:hypothetical protein
MNVVRKWQPEFISAAILVVALLIVAFLPAGVWRDRVGYVAYGAVASIAYFLANRFVFNKKPPRGTGSNGD